MRGAFASCRPIVVLLLAGCAAGSDCATNSFELGQRDGVLAALQGTQRYVASCGASFDAARYAEGYHDGFSRRPPPQGD